MWVYEVQVFATAKCEVPAPLQTKHLQIPNIDEFSTGVSKISNLRPSR